MKTNKIIIVGGGTAGWATALNFFQKTHCNITVIATKEIPIIGVGESTTGRFNNLINLKESIQIDEADFLKKTGSTYKIGIYHTDWHTKGESFTSPLGDNYSNVYEYPHFSYDYYRIFHVAEKMKFEAIGSKLMINNKLPFMWIDKNDPYLIEYDNRTGKIDLRLNHVAYHLDTYKVGQYIKEKVLEQKKRVSYIDDEVVDFQQDNTGIVKYLITKTGQKIEGDLFVDCSGFKRVLIDKVCDNKFISYENQLLVNRALPFYIENEDHTIINNYTHVTAKKYGWLWDIPLQHRKGMGYVYSDNYTTPEQAQQEIEKDLGKKIEPRNDIKFTPGRLEKFWYKNVISTGLSSAFVEPLEATSIHCTVLQINHFIEKYFTHNLNFNDEISQNWYNKDMTTLWDDIKDFIVLHYHTPRNDTQFWTDSSSDKRKSEILKQRLEVWKTRMPRINDFKGGLNDTFYDLGNTLWYQILIGMKVLDSDVAKKELKSFDLYDKAKIDYERRLKFDNHILSKSLRNNHFYKKELKYLKDYYRIRYA